MQTTHLSTFPLLTVACVGMLSLAATAQDHRVRSSSGRTPAGNPFVDIQIENISSPYDPLRDITSFDWRFRYTTDPGDLVWPEPGDFVVTRPLAGGDRLTVTGTGLQFTVFKTALSAFGDDSFRIEYAPTQQAGDTGDPAAADLHFRDRDLIGVSWVIRDAAGVNHGYPWKEASLTKRRLLERTVDPRHGGAGIWDGLDGLGADDGLVAVTYRSGGQLWCAVSPDEGSSWTQHVVATTSGPNLWLWQPARTIVHAGHIYVVWADSGAGVSRIFFACSRDEGQTWTQTAIPAPWGVPHPQNRMVVVPDPAGNPAEDHVHLIVRRLGDPATTTAAELYAMHSFDGGATFQGQVVSSTPNGYWVHGLTASRQAVHILYESTVGGAPRLITTRNRGGNYSSQPLTDLDGAHWFDLHCRNNTVVVGGRQWGWPQPHPYMGRICAMVSADAAATWSRARTIGSHDPAVSPTADMVVRVVHDQQLGADVPAVLWEGPTSGGTGFLLSRSVNAGLSWSAEMLIQNGGRAQADQPCITSHGGTLAILRDEELIYSHDAGITFADPVTTQNAREGGGLGPPNRGGLVYDARPQRAYASFTRPFGSTLPPAVGSYRLQAASTTVRNSGTNSPVLTATSMVAGDTWLVDVDMSPSASVLAHALLGTSQVDLPIPTSLGVQRLLIGGVFASVTMTGAPRSEFRIDLPAVFYYPVMVQAAMIDTAGNLRLTNAVDLVPSSGH